MRLATFDVGSNTVLMLAAEVDQRRQPRILAELSRITRLGRGVDRNRRLDSNAAALTLATIPALADQQYDVRGEDVYRVGTAGVVSRVAYSGEQRLTVERVNGQTRYDAQAHYNRNSSDGSSQINARFVQELSPNGSFVDKIDDDPDFRALAAELFSERGFEAPMTAAGRNAIRTPITNIRALESVNRPVAIAHSFTK